MVKESGEKSVCSIHGQDHRFDQYRTGMDGVRFYSCECGAEKPASVRPDVTKPNLSTARGGRRVPKGPKKKS